MAPDEGYLSTNPQPHARREPLTRLRYREATLSHKGRG
ncbi:hypothetical protein ACVWY3_006609 [Bradyrhizobium sp. USDA 4486]